MRFFIYHPRYIMMLMLSVAAPALLQAAELDDIRARAASGDTRGAIAALKKSPAAGLKSYQLLLARLHLDSNQLRDAARIYERLCPRVGTADCWNRSGVTRMSMGGYKQAVGAFKKALALDSRSARTYSNLGLAYFYMRRMTEAGEAHAKALSLEPDNVTVRLNHAVFLFASRKYHRAEAIFRNLARNNRGLFFAHLYLGRIYFKQRQYRRALQEFDQGIGANPRFFELYYHRAHTRYRLRDYGGAMSDVRKADKLEPLNGQTGPLKRAIKRRRR